MLTDYELQAELKDNIRYAQDFWGPFVQNANVYGAAAAGSSWTQAEIKQLLKDGREPVEFNIMRRSLQFFSGYLRDNLNSIVISPVEGSDQLTADQFTKLSYDVWDKGDGYSTLLDASDEGFKAGLALCGIRMDYSKDFTNGDIKFFKRTYNSFYLDPTFEKIDLSDCGFAVTRDIMTKAATKAMMPFIDPKEIDDVSVFYADDKFMSYHPQIHTITKNKNLVAYDQYYRRITKTRQMWVDEASGMYFDITEKTKEEVERIKLGIHRVLKLHEEVKAMGKDTRELPPITKIVSVERSFVELNVLVNGKPVYQGDDPTHVNDRYPFAPIVCYMEPSIWDSQLRVQGIPATLYSIGRQFNKRHMKIQDMMDSSISTGYKYMVGSIADPTDLQQTGQNKIIGIDPENSPAGMESVQELRGGEANQSLLEYQKILSDLTLTLSNVNESNMGVDDKGNTQISGKLAQVRIAQGLRGNRKIFDSVETAQQCLAGIIVKAIQLNMPPEKVKRILGEEPTEQFYKNQFEQYDAVIKEGVRSQSQRDAYYYELVNLKRDQIVDVPQEAIVDALGMAGLTDLKKAIEKQSQDIQMQQQAQAQAQQEMTQKEMNLLDASVEEKLALSEERKGRTQSNIALAAERVSASEENRAQAAYEKAKTIVEISKLHEDRILQVLDYVNQLNTQEVADREAEGMKVEARVKEIDESIPDLANAQQGAGDTQTESQGG